MMTSDSIPRKYLYVLFVIAILAQCFAIVLFILLTVFDYIGFNGGTPISTTTCTQNYYTNKYAQISILVQASYLCTIISLAAFSVVLALMIKIVLRAYQGTQANIFFPKCTKITIYILTAIAIMSSMPTVGYYLSFMIQLSGCSTYDNVKVGLVLAFSIILALLLLVFMILLFMCLNQTADSNYGQVERASTEPVEPAEEPKYVSKKYFEKEEAPKKQPEVYEKRTPQELSRNSPPRKIQNHQQLEHTKQNLNNSPARQPTINVYSKQISPRHQPRNTHQNSYNPSKTPPPVLEPKTYKKQAFISGNSRNYMPSKQGELVFSKARKNNFNDDEEFNKQQSRFISNYGGRPILDTSGNGESSRQRKHQNNYFHQNEPLPKKNVQHISPARKGRQGNLLNYIRGKYAE